VNEDRPTVAVLGAGTMGAPMARNIAAAGMPVRIWNRTRERAEAVEGAEAADTPAAAAGGAHIVVSILTDADAVEAVITGDDGALGAMSGDAVWAQMSTVGLEATERLQKLAADAGVPYVDAPVLGTKQPAEQGQLIVLASGPEDALARCEPVFEAVGSKVVRAGEAGAGTRLKLVVNTWLVALVEGLAETIAFAQAIGVDPQAFLDTIEGGPMGPAYAQLKGKLMIDRSFDPAFSLALARKDAKLVLDAAAESGFEAPLIETVVRQMDRAVELGHGDDDMAAIYEASRPERAE
jgi:3-hydroxyisobutyrate dehydrogenase